MKKAIAVAATAALLTACNTPFTPDGVSGTYRLVTANGLTLPAELTVFDQATLTFENGSVTLRADGTYSLAITQSFASGGQTQSDTFTETGTFSLTEPNSITITSSDGESVSGNLVGGVLTVTADIEDGVSVVFVFEKS
jgi:hypothetical protein